MELTLMVEDLSTFTLISSNGERWRLIKEETDSVIAEESTTFATSEWAQELVDVSWNTLKDKILNPHRKNLESNGIVIYGGVGKPYKFHKEKFKKWIDTNGRKIKWKS